MARVLPARWPRLAWWLALPVALAGPATAQLAPATTAPNSARSASALDAPLFYQLLIGELELRSGRPGNAQQVILDAARRVGDDALYQRAVDIALQARAGDQALSAARAWRQAKPRNTVPLRYEAQILLALGRTPDAAEPLKAWLALLPADQQAGLIASLPRFFQRAAAPDEAAAAIERLTEPYRDTASTRSAVALARAWAQWQAGHSAQALALAESVPQTDPKAVGVPLLALELMAKQPQAEALVKAYVARPGGEPGIHLAYIRTLIQAQRWAEAGQRLDALTRERPDLAEAWLMLGALRVELRQPEAAEQALQRHIALAQQPSVPGEPASRNDDEGDDSAGQDPRAANLSQARLLLAQAAEQRGDWVAAERWLAQIDEPQRLLEVQTRRAVLLARQGRLPAAVAMVRAVPERTGDDARAKVLAEAQVMREVKRWAEAAAALRTGLKQSPDDIDLLYELSMVEEKRGRFDEMERLLRRVIALKPEHPHAHNALGYSLADRSLRLDEARSLIERALALAPGDPFIIDSMGWVEFRLGRRTEAIRLLRQAYAARPDTEIGVHLGEVLWADGQREEARRIWRDAQARDADNEVLRETLSRLAVGEP